MPLALPRRCTTWGCRNNRPCAVHAASKTRVRGAHQALYATTRWRVFRRIVLQERPLCEDCKANGGRLTIGNELHHVKKLADGGDAFSRENIRVLCKRCHTARTVAGE